MKFAAGKKGYRNAVYHLVEKEEVIVSIKSEEWANRICSALITLHGIQLEDDDGESDLENTFSVEPDGSSGGWIIRHRIHQKELIFTAHNLAEDDAFKLAARLNDLLSKGGE